MTSEEILRFEEIEEGLEDGLKKIHLNGEKEGGVAKNYGKKTEWGPRETLATEREKGTTGKEVAATEQENEGASKQKIPFTVLVEGNIGSGKTTFLQHFAEFEHVDVKKEPVGRWMDLNGNNLLELMYGDPKRWALLFQSYAQLTLMENHRHSQGGKSVKIMERSVFSARYCFAENMHQSKMLGDSEFCVLDQWFKFVNEECNINVDLIVYLRTTPETALERVKKRNRSEEAGISLDYLTELHNLHEDWLVHKSHPVPAPVLVINADMGIAEVKDECMRHESVVFGVVQSRDGADMSRVATVWD